VDLDLPRGLRQLCKRIYDYQPAARLHDTPREVAFQIVELSRLDTTGEDNDMT
jgi:hypothetical protein